MNTSLSEPTGSTSTTRRFARLVTPPYAESKTRSLYPHGTYLSTEDEYSSCEDSEEVDLRQVSAFDEMDGEETVGGDQNDKPRHCHQNNDNIRHALSFDEARYDDSDDEYQDGLLWSIILSNRCHKSLQSVLSPAASASRDQQSMASTQVTEVISNKKKSVFPNIRKLSLAPALDIITGATVEGSTYTNKSDKSNKSNDSNSSSSWNSLWCCGPSQIYSDDSLTYIQRRLFSSSKAFPPIPDFVLMNNDRAVSSSLFWQHQFDNDEEMSTSITVFEDDDSFWTV